MAHSSLGASSSKRWMSCPGSVRLISQLPPEEQNRTSVHAREGNAAHALAAECLLRGMMSGVFKDHVMFETPKGEWQRRVGSPAGRTEFTVTNEMIEAVDEYIESVQKSVIDMGRDAQLLVETQVSPLDDRPEMYGTGDAIVYKPFGPLVVHDLKYGKGVRVEAKRNPQIMYYGLGAMRAVGGWEMVESVELVINQPRAGGERRDDISPRELSEWGSELRVAADRTKDPDAPLVVGEWCQFCPAARRRIQNGVAISQCPAQEAEAQGAAQALILAETHPPTLTVPDDPAAISRALAIIPAFRKWAAGVEEYGLWLGERGIAVPGYKVVRKRANRQWTDEGAAILELELAGLSPAEYLVEPELLSPAQIEKLPKLGKPTERKALVGKLTTKPEGGLTLVEDDDPRPAAQIPLLSVTPILSVTEGSVDDFDWMA